MERSTRNRSAIEHELRCSYEAGEPLCAAEIEKPDVAPLTGSNTRLVASVATPVPSNNPEQNIIQLMQEPPTPISTRVPDKNYYRRLGFKVE